MGRGGGASSEGREVVSGNLRVAHGIEPRALNFRAPVTIKLMLSILKPALIYFALVFGAGFLLGPVRILWLVPRVGVRMAELLEMPVMLIVIFCVARWIVGRYSIRAGRKELLAIGGLALACLLAAELSLVLLLQGISLQTYLAQRDPVSGTAYLISLLLFALMPTLVARAGKAGKE